MLLARPVLFWATALAVAGFLGAVRDQRRQGAAAPLAPAHRHRGADGHPYRGAPRGGPAGGLPGDRLPAWPATTVLGYLLAFACSAAVLGTTVFVTYLRVADWWGSHTLEAFSGLRITGYKSHLRLRVTDDGVEVQVIGIDQVPATRHARHCATTSPGPTWSTPSPSAPA